MQRRSFAVILNEVSIANEVEGSGQLRALGVKPVPVSEFAKRSTF
jgi:hypothetical protein